MYMHDKPVEYTMDERELTAEVSDIMRHLARQDADLIVRLMDDHTSIARLCERLWLHGLRELMTEYEMSRKASEDRDLGAPVQEGGQ